jgi:hypothetical protein
MKKEGIMYYGLLFPLFAYLIVGFDGSTLPQGKPEEAKNVGEPNFFLLVKEKFEKDGWKMIGNPIRFEDKAVFSINIDGKRQKLKHDTRLKNSWVIYYGPTPIPKNKKEKMVLFFQRPLGKEIIFEFAPDKFETLSIAEKPSKQSTEDKAAVTLSISTAEASNKMLILLQNRVEVIQGERKLFAGYTNNYSMVEFVKTPDKKKMGP